MRQFCDCIIPFYNEASRIGYVIKELSRVPSISRIICIDDGSTDLTSEIIEKTFPRATLVRLSENIGKSDAVFTGLRHVNSDYVLLFDADLQNVHPEEIEHVLKHIQSDEAIDMCIFRAHGSKGMKYIDGLLRNYIVQSGLRVLKTSDLREVARLHPKRYQLEVAINQYMIDKKKYTCWYPISAYNPHKSVKQSFISGWKEDIIMEFEILKYVQIHKQVIQILNFCRKRL